MIPAAVAVAPSMQRADYCAARLARVRRASIVLSSCPPKEQQCGNGLVDGRSERRWPKLVVVTGKIEGDFACLISFVITKS